MEKWASRATRMSDFPDISDLLLAWEDSVAQGRELPPEEFCRDRPELLDELKRQIQALRAMRWMEEPDIGDDPEPLPAPQPTNMGRYRLEHRIGEGGFGEVWKAFDPDLQRMVAIKVPRPDRTTPRDMDTFLAEGRKVASLRHPGIVPVFDVGQIEGRWFIVSEFIDGTDLARLLESRRLSLEETIRLVAEIAEHLQYAHQQGFVHQDLKPSNILLDRAGRSYLTDFGIAVSLHEGRADNRPFGTLPYMAPESLSGDERRPDPKSDIYGLGVVFYELLAGRLPFEADSTADLRTRILSSEPPPLRTLRPGIPEELQAICLKCLAKDPTSRYLTAGDLAQSLRTWLANRPRPLRRLIIGALLVGTVVVAAVGGPMFLRHQPEIAPPNQRNSSPPPSSDLPVKPKANLIQFHPMQREIYVMDATAQKILYSLDGKAWTEAESFRIEGGALQWAAAVVKREDMQALAAATKPRLFVKFVNDRGEETEAVEFNPSAAELELPAKVPTITVPRTTVSDVPQLPEDERRRLDEIRHQLHAEGSRVQPSEH